MQKWTLTPTPPPRMSLKSLVAELARLDRERGERTAVKANADQVIAQLSDFLVSGIRWPLRAASITAQPRKGETLQASRSAARPGVILSPPLHDLHRRVAWQSTSDGESSSSRSAVRQPRGHSRYVRSSADKCGASQCCWVDLNSTM